jgi:cell fate (sporulation/competence/biofilm development) regulator YlbF (YheA/YmcA/DUF963 family)
MAVYNRAHELARALADSLEFAEYQKARAAIEKDEGAIWVLKDFRKRQLDVEMAQMRGEKPSDDQIKQLTQLAQAISLHVPVSQFIASEMRLLRMASDVQNIIGESLKLWDYMELGQLPDKGNEEKK